MFTRKHKYHCFYIEGPKRTHTAYELKDYPKLSINFSCLSGNKQIHSRCVGSCNSYQYSSFFY